MADSSDKREGRQSKRRNRSRRHNPDGTMTLIEHIYEFRRRLGYALLALVAGGILGFLWFGNRIGPIPSLGDIVTGPYCAIPAEQRYPRGGECQLLQTVPFEAFMIQLRVGLTAGAVLFAPVWLYQLWAFIAPGLYSKERKYALTFVGFASVLFAGGAVLAYLMVPHALELLTNFGGGEFATWFTGDRYISFVLSLLLIFGVSFELPLLIVMLNRVGIARYELLKKWRRGIIFLLFVFAAFVTPADPFSMIALAGALTLLFEFALQLTRLHDRKLERQRGEEGWDKLADDEAAPFDYTPSTIDDEPAKPTKAASTDDVT
ncbi:twin-arginine translocase subunit TatC [Prauserella sp. PE36]|uniref:twin-arginine translocase subunit TatC n=1 Tax=Prauserella sp. PE36 TaxID=1504709 RepID=UPI000D987CE8|nr:twin-arginine translocase subunit TatC [Prauserella sp. PE36]PXY30217.1 twin arginine-targeting protein translocase TatC [Prauserella coralliicola]RBM22674.1 twin-arginine translocase subunit TatC [Prauserella sp. PE36]